MSYINVILLIMSIIGLLISLLTLVKSIYIVIIRFIKIKKINNEEVRYKITNIEHCENIKEGNTIWNDVYIMQNLNNTYLTLVDSCSGKVIASINQFPCIVGRGIPADIIIDFDKAISRRHVVFTFENGNLFVNDLESSNGTLINGCRILSKCEVKNGDIMKIGRTEIKLVVNF